MRLQCDGKLVFKKKERGNWRVIKEFDYNFTTTIPEEVYMLLEKDGRLAIYAKWTW